MFFSISNNISSRLIFFTTDTGITAIKLYSFLYNSIILAISSLFTKSTLFIIKIVFLLACLILSKIILSPFPISSAAVASITNNTTSTSPIAPKAVSTITSPNLVLGL